MCAEGENLASASRGGQGHDGPVLDQRLHRRGSLLFDERLDRRQWIGSAIGVLGVVFAVADEMQGSLTVGGLLLSLLGVGGLASGTLVQRHRVGAVDPRSANTIQLAAVPVLGQALKPGVVVGLVLSLVGVSWSAVVAPGARPA